MWSATAGLYAANYMLRPPLMQSSVAYISLHGWSTAGDRLYHHALPILSKLQFRRTTDPDRFLWRGKCHDHRRILKAPSPDSFKISTREFCYESAIRLEFHCIVLTTRNDASIRD